MELTFTEKKLIEFLLNKEGSDIDISIKDMMDRGYSDQNIYIRHARTEKEKVEKLLKKIWE
jgi:hypothetical protein